MVEVKMAVGGRLVGAIIDVGSAAGTAAGVQAVRRNKETMMKFFMINIICHTCTRFAWQIVQVQVSQSTLAMTCYLDISSNKSFHSGFKLFIKSIFFWREPPLICFSLASAE